MLNTRNNKLSLLYTKILINSAALYFIINLVNCTEVMLNVNKLENY